VKDDAQLGVVDLQDVDQGMPARFTW
jgi:hypothetical protein